MQTLRELVNTFGSQSEAARRIGVSQPAVHGWLRGKRPTPLAVAAIARAVARPVDEIRAIVEADHAARQGSPAVGPAVGPGAEGAGGAHAADGIGAGAA